MKKILFLSLLFHTLMLGAQDPHYSQFGNVCFHNNPAQTGFNESQFRLSMNSKVQWSSVGPAFQSHLAAFDFGLMRRSRYLDMLGAGVEIQRDLAGDADFGTTRIGVSLSYIKALNNRNNHFISGGLGFSFNQRSMDINMLTYDAQYNGYQFDPSLSGNENYSEINFWYPDLIAGVYYLKRFNSVSDFNCGFSISHPARPAQSHFDNASVRLDPRYLVQFAYRTGMKHDLEIIPAAYFTFQGPFVESIIGAKIRLVTNYSRFEYNAFSAGLYWRHRDALIFTAGMEYLWWQLGLSYDLNVSDLTPASNLKGGFEFSLIRTFDKPERKKNREIPCPIF